MAGTSPAMGTRAKARPGEVDAKRPPSQDFRQLGLGGSDPPRGDALRQAQRLDRLVQPKDELSLEVMLFCEFITARSQHDPEGCRLFG
jgi:hypothetical protein